jgi:hypothetical protein
MFLRNVRIQPEDYTTHKAYAWARHDAMKVYGGHGVDPHEMVTGHILRQNYPWGQCPRYWMGGPRTWTLCTCRESNSACPVTYVSETLRTESVWSDFRNVIKARVQVLTASMKMPVFWDVAPCSLIDIDRRFRGTSCLHCQVFWDVAPCSLVGIDRYWQGPGAGGSKLLWDVGQYLLDTRRNFPEDNHIHSMM